MLPSSYTPIHNNNKPLEIKRILNTQEIKNIFSPISTNISIIDSENYFTDWEIEQINESLSDYAAGNYKTFSDISELLKELHS